MTSRLLGSAVSLVCCFGLWLLLVNTYERPELLAGAGASVIATAVGARALRGEVEWRLVLEGVRSLPAVVLRGLRDSVTVLWMTVLHATRVRAAHGTWRSEAVTVGRRARRDATRRALHTLARSFAPTTLVIGHSTSQQTMVLHELAPRRRRRRAAG